MAFVWIETHEDFVKQHGGNPLVVGNQILLPDGAATSRDAVVRYDPPKNKFDLLHAKRAYWAEALRLAEVAFLEAQADLAQQTALAIQFGNLPGPGGGEAQRILLGLKEDVANARMEIEWLDGELEKTHEVRAIRAEQQRRTSFVARLHQTQAAIHEISLD